jgi:hypothetical protein
MATSTVLSNPVFKVGAVDLSDQCTNATLSQKTTALQANAFGSTAITYTAGLQDNSLSVDLYWSTAATETYATLKSLVGSGTVAVTITPDPVAGVSATNPAMTFTNTFLASLPLTTAVAALGTYSITLSGGSYAEVVTP